MFDAQALALFVAGFLAPFLTQALKNWLGDLQGKPALFLFAAVSFVIAWGALLVTGGLPPLSFADPLAFFGSLLNAAASVFALGTLVYKIFISKAETPPTA